MFFLDLEDSPTRYALKSEQKLLKTAAVVELLGSLGEILGLFLMQGPQLGSTGLLITFSQCLMDPIVSNFAHCAYGIMLDQLSVWFSIDALRLQGHSVRPLRGKTSGFLEALLKCSRKITSFHFFNVTMNATVEIVCSS